MTTHSKTPQDNTALFLSCAHEWIISETSTQEERAQNKLPHNKLPHNKLGQESFNQNPSDQNNFEQNNFEQNNFEQNNFEQNNFQQNKSSKKITKNSNETLNPKTKTHTTIPLQFSHFFSNLHDQLLNACPCSLYQSEAKALNLLQTPHESLNWHLYLFPEKEQEPEKNSHIVISNTFSPKKNFKKSHHESSNESSQITNDESSNITHEASYAHMQTENEVLPQNELISWLKHGMAKGWLRHVPISNFTEILPNLYLPQDTFWQRFSSQCDCTNRVCLVLFQLPEMQVEKKNTHKTKIRYLPELIEQILLTIKDTDFFGEIKDFGLALVLNDCGSFSATASAERILTRLEKIFLENSKNNSLENTIENTQPHTLQNNKTTMQIPIQVAVAEKEEGDNADTLFAHAKEVIHARERKNMHLAQVTQNKTRQTSSVKNIAQENISHKNILIAPDDLPIRNETLRVHVYRNSNKVKEKNSLVQSDEKRFLFFGCH